MGRAFSPEGALVLACFLGFHPSWGFTPPGAAPQAVMERAFGPWGFVGVDTFLGLYPSWGFTPPGASPQAVMVAGLWPLVLWWVEANWPLMGGAGECVTADAKIPIVPIEKSTTLLR